MGPPEDRPGPRRHRPAGRTGRVSPVRRARPDVEIRAEAELSLAGAAEERARDRIARSRKRHEEKPDGADECNCAGLGLPGRSPAIA